MKPSPPLRLTFCGKTPEEESLKQEAMTENQLIEIILNLKPEMHPMHKKGCEEQIIDTTYKHQLQLIKDAPSALCATSLIAPNKLKLLQISLLPLPLPPQRGEGKQISAGVSSIN